MICGQCCVAMLTGGDLEGVIKRFGHTYGTGWREIIRHLRDLRVRAMPYPASIKSQPKPNQCVVRVKSKTFTHGSHFVVYSHGHWWDPAYGVGEGIKRHPDWPPHLYQSSYVEILGYMPGYRHQERRPAKPLQPTFTADEWQKMDTAQKNSIVRNVFGFDHATDCLGSAWQVGKQMAANGFSFEWNGTGAEGFYCLMDGAETSHVGWGPNYSEALCAASLAATGFLLQRGKSANKFPSNESKANTKVSTRP